MYVCIYILYYIILYYIILYYIILYYIILYYILYYIYYIILYYIILYYVILCYIILYYIILYYIILYYIIYTCIQFRSPFYIQFYIPSRYLNQNTMQSGGMPSATTPRLRLVSMVSSQEGTGAQDVIGEGSVSMIFTGHCGDTLVIWCHVYWRLSIYIYIIPWHFSERPWCLRPAFYGAFGIQPFRTPKD